MKQEEQTAWVEEGCEGDANCQHEWVWRDGNGVMIVIDTFPPITHVRCKKCGRVEHGEV